jgi:hypothetical protein
MNYLPLLRTAVRATFGCDCEHLATLRVHTVTGGIIWDGTVEQFTLKGYPYAKHAFGWMEQTAGGKANPFVILKMSPVETAEDAVQAMFDRAFCARAE